MPKRPSPLPAWLERQIDSGLFKGLKWVERKQKKFRIPWKHGSSHDWDQSEDAALFKAWAMHKSTLKPGQRPKKWKANFRCAVSACREITWIDDESCIKGNDPYKVCRFTKKDTTKKLKTKSLTLKKEFEKNNRRVKNNAMKRSYSEESHPGSESPYSENEAACNWIKEEDFNKDVQESCALNSRFLNNLPMMSTFLRNRSDSAGSTVSSPSSDTSVSCDRAELCGENSESEAACNWIKGDLNNDVEESCALNSRILNNFNLPIMETFLKTRYDSKLDDYTLPSPSIDTSMEGNTYRNLWLSNNKADLLYLKSTSNDDLFIQNLCAYSNQDSILELHEGLDDLSTYLMEGDDS